MKRSNNPTGPSTSRRHGARSVNIADNERIPMLVEMSDALSRAAHTLKSALRIFGADVAVERAGRLEDLGRSGQLQQASEVYRALKSDVDRMAPELVTFVAGGGIG